MANETTHGRYVIRSMKVGGQWNARAFQRKTAIGTVHVGVTEEAAIIAVKAAIDANREVVRFVCTGSRLG